MFWFYLVGWIVLGAIGAGRFYAEIQRDFPTIAEETRKGDIAIAWMFFITGPVVFLASIFLGRRGCVINDRGKRRYWKVTGREYITPTYVTIGDPSKSNMNGIFGGGDESVEITKEEFDSSF